MSIAYLPLTLMNTLGNSASATAVAPASSDPILITTEPLDLFPLIIICGGMLVAIVIVTTAIIAGVITSKQREQTRREVAAYLAEGSITSDDAERILSAQMTSDD